MPVPSRLDEIADIDATGGHDTIEGGDHVLEAGQCLQAVHGGALRLDVGLGHFHPRFRRGEARALAQDARLGIVRVLLRGPALHGEGRGAAVGGGGEIHVGLRLIDHGPGLEQLGFELADLRLGLCQLLVEIGGGDADEDVALLDPRADIDPALCDVAGGTGEEGRPGEGVGLSGQGDVDGLVGPLHRDGPQFRHEIPRLALRLLGRGGLLPMAVPAPAEQADGNEPGDEERPLPRRRRDLCRASPRFMSPHRAGLLIDRVTRAVPAHA